MDYFTKWPEAYALPNQVASTKAEALVTNFCRFGIPRELHRDQGRNFESRLLQEILQRLGVSKTRTTPLHPVG
jgi:transposase InsO family protein